MCKLTDKQQRFVEEYLIDLTAKQAAIRAGYSSRTADKQGSQLLDNPRVREALDFELAKRSKRTGITADRVLREYARIAFADMRDYATWNESVLLLKPSQDLSRDDTAAIEEIKLTETKFGTNLSIKLHDKGRALDMVAKHLGMVKDTTELTGKGGSDLFIGLTDAIRKAIGIDADSDASSDDEG